MANEGSFWTAGQSLVPGVRFQMISRHMHSRMTLIFTHATAYISMEAESAKVYQMTKGVTTIRMMALIRPNGLSIQSHHILFRNQQCKLVIHFRSWLAP